MSHYQVHEDLALGAPLGTPLFKGEEHRDFFSSDQYQPSQPSETASSTTPSYFSHDRTDTDTTTSEFSTGSLPSDQLASAQDDSNGIFPSLTAHLEPSSHRLAADHVEHQAEPEQVDGTNSAVIPSLTDHLQPSTRDLALDHIEHQAEPEAAVGFITSFIPSFIPSFAPSFTDQLEPSSQPLALDHVEHQAELEEVGTASSLIPSLTDHLQPSIRALASDHIEHQASPLQEKTVEEAGLFPSLTDHLYPSSSRLIASDHIEHQSEEVQTRDPSLIPSAEHNHPQHSSYSPPVVSTQTRSTELYGSEITGTALGAQLASLPPADEPPLVLETKEYMSNYGETAAPTVVHREEVVEKVPELSPPPVHPPEVVPPPVASDSAPVVASPTHRKAPAFANAPIDGPDFASGPIVVAPAPQPVIEPGPPEATAAIGPRERVSTKPNIINQAAIPADERTPTAPPPPVSLADQLSAYLPKPSLSELNLTAAPPPTTAPLPGEQTEIDRLHPREALPAVHPDVVHPVSAEERDREVEKVKAGRRELMGHAPQGTVVMGLEDDRLWAMLRRFDRQVNHVLSPPHGLPEGQPDLRRSTLPTVPYNSDLVKSNIERCYGTAGISGIRFGREMARLMSWAPEERKRTGAFCAAYFMAWMFHQTTPLIIGLLMTLVLYSPSRAYLFPVLPPPPPGQPLSATDPTNRNGDESLVDVSHPQKHRSKHEQIEEQSWEFTKSIEKFGVRILLGSKHKPSSAQMDKANEMDKNNNPEADAYGPLGEDADQDQDQDKQLSGRNGRAGESERDRVLKDGGSLKHSNQKEGEKAKGERDAQVGLLAKGLQDGLGDFADIMEMFQIALSPVSVYPPNHARFKIAFVVLFPALIITAVVPAQVFAHAGSFALGFGFFGQPIIKRGIRTFVHLVPNWKEELDLRNSILSGVPTNVQLTMHILRQRELARNPLPRAPLSVTSAEARKQLNDTSLISEAHEENSVSSVGSGSAAHMVGDGKHEEGQSERGKKLKSKVVQVGQKISAKAALFRGHGKVAVLPDAEMPENYEKTEKQGIKTRLSKFLLDRDTLKDEGSIWAYPATYDKTDGHLIIESTNDTPTTDATMLFVPTRSSKPKVSFPIADIAELKKGGIGLPRSILGWAAGMDLGGTGLEFRVKKHEAIYQGKEVAPGVFVDNVYFEDEAESEMEGDLYQFDRVGRRDQLFIRLLSLAEQDWETL